MLRAGLLFTLVSYIIAADFTIRCGSNKDIGVTFDKTEGDVEGRYTVEYCSQIPKRVNVWSLSLEYTVNNRQNGTACEANTSRIVQHSRSRKMRMHSHDSWNITSIPQCNITCLSMPLDLVFSSCYMIVNQFTGDPKPTGEVSTANKYTHAPVYSFHWIHNIFSSVEAINKLQPIFDIQKNDHELVVTYNLHYIRVNVFGMERKEYKENSTTKEIDELVWEDIRSNCSEDAVTVVCKMRYPSPDHCVLLSLKFHAPWRDSIHDPSVMKYCSPPSEEVVMDPGMDARVLWAVGALALTVTLLAACWAAHTKVLADVRKKVLRRWVDRYTAYTAEPTPAMADPGYILLLYARDCEPAMEAISVLKEMLESGAPGRVYDLFSPECVAMYAHAPEEWLCGVLSRADVRVVLLQTPAAAALYAAQVSPDNLHMQQPLLGARVHYKKPHYGDILLQFALRLVRDNAPMQQEYARYYIATVSELESELMPQVAPYRRYALPAHAARLLADLRLPAAAPAPAPAPAAAAAPAAAPAPAPRARRLAAALRALQQHVSANENYLRDELMFI